MTKYPVRYPTACSPQAWSTGAPLLLLRTMLGPRAGRASTSWSTRCCRRRSAISSCSTSPAAGAGSTRSAAAASTSSNGTATAAAHARPRGRHDDQRLPDHQGRHRRRRVRRRRLCPRAGEARRRPRHAHRPERLPPVPAAAVPGRDIDARPARHRLSAAQDRGGVQGLRGEARRGGRDRPGRADRRRPTPARRYGGRLPRARRRLAAQLLRHARGRARVPALLARRRRAAAARGSSRRSRRPTATRR